MNPIKTFLLVPTDTHRVWLRRYCSGLSIENLYQRPAKYHDAMTLVGDMAQIKTSDGYIDSISPDVYADDPRWPSACACGYQFGALPPDEFQVFTRELYRRDDTGEVLTVADAPEGAIWNAWWMNDFRDHRGEDGQSLHVRLPGGHDWNIDSRASNCDSPCAVCGRPFHVCNADEKREHGYKDSRPHKCWVRHGTAPRLTVDKAGVTCGAGAGSIMVPGYHGFLTDGELRSC